MYAALTLYATQVSTLYAPQISMISYIYIIYIGFIKIFLSIFNIKIYFMLVVLTYISFIIFANLMITLNCPAIVYISLFLQVVLFNNSSCYFIKATVIGYSFLTVYSYRVKCVLNNCSNLLKGINHSIQYSCVYGCTHEISYILI